MIRVYLGKATEKGRDRLKEGEKYERLWIGVIKHFNNK